MEEKLTKIAELRNNEYYFQQEEFDYLYKISERNYNFYSLMKRITKESNIKLAYRNIKANKGSKTKGLSGKNMQFISKMQLKTYITLMRNELGNYKPSKIRRVGIPKSNGKTRYLGIKEPWDKIFEQMIYQILDPIVTAKFHNNSNGFIKGRSCRRAIAQFNTFVIKEKLYFCIDIDIKSFFDNVNHGKLIKQLWTIGIRDKSLLKVISKMLKAEIFKEGIPEAGTPQGGILSPLLANVVLNELDWWLDSKENKGIKFVRYADDLRILCPTYRIASDMLDKTKKWIQERLKLEVNEEKTKIINLKRNYTTFLGCKIKIKKKNDKYKIISHISDKAIENCKVKVKKQIRVINKTKTNQNKCEKEVNLYNSIVSGIHNYYEMNTNIAEDLQKIDYIIGRYIYKKLRNVLEIKDIKNKSFVYEKYGKDKTLPYIRGKPLIPIGRITYNSPKFTGKTEINYFKMTSRIFFHEELKLENVFVLQQIEQNPKYEKTVEFNDNVLSKFCGQYGKYAITNNTIYDIKNIGFVKKNEQKSDKYDNILIVEKKVELLIKLKEGLDDMNRTRKLIQGLTSEQLKKINKLRKENSLPSICW